MSEHRNHHQHMAGAKGEEVADIKQSMVLSPHHSAHNDGHFMKMWFHSGCSEVVLFEFWQIDSVVGVILSCLIIFIAAALYEGIKWFRVYLQLSSLRSSQEAAAIVRTASSSMNADRKHTSEDITNGKCVRSVLTPLTGISPSRAEDDSPFSRRRFVQAALYLVQLTLAYWLMLVAMTYNIWLTTAVVTGATFGHWLFAVLKYFTPQADHLDTFSADACH